MQQKNVGIVFVKTCTYHTSSNKTYNITIYTWQTIIITLQWNYISIKQLSIYQWRATLVRKKIIFYESFSENKQDIHKMDMGSKYFCTKRNNITHTSVLYKSWQRNNNNNTTCISKFNGFSYIQWKHMFLVRFIKTCLLMWAHKQFKRCL